MLQSVPVIGRDIAMEEALIPIDPALKKRLADIALNAARSKGASYADVRIGRYLNQFLTLLFLISKIKEYHPRS